MSEEQATVSPALIVSPFVRSMSEPDAATPQCITTVPPLVSSVAVATGDALPVALVSLVIALAVAVPLELAPNAVADNGNVAAAVPGDDTVPLSRNFRFPLAPINAVTASVAASLAAVECVVAIVYSSDYFVCFCESCCGAGYFYGHPQLAALRR